MEDLKKMLFDSQRFLILQTKINSQTANFIPDDYAFAWNERLYPIFDDEGLAVTYEDCFGTKKELVSKVVEYLDSEWAEERYHTFNEVRDYFSYTAKIEIDKYTLINILRYVYLHGAFDKQFWNTLLKNGECPIEAKSITSGFSVSNLNLCW